MKEVLIKVYGIDELKEEAKQKAYSNWLKDWYYMYSTENEATLEAFKNVFPISNVNYEYGYRSYIRFSMDTEYSEIDEMSGIRLYKYLWNNYKNDIYKGKYYSKMRYKEGKLVGSYARHSKVILETSCVFTGYYMDNVILEPIYNFLEKFDEDSIFTTFEDLLEACLENWCKYADEDYSNTSSMEYFLEEVEELEIEYLEDGTVFKG